MIKHILLLISTLTVLAVFQNCSDVAFNDGNAQLVAKNDGDLEDQTLEVEDNNVDDVVENTVDDETESKNPTANDDNTTNESTNNNDKHDIVNNDKKDNSGTSGGGCNKQRDHDHNSPLSSNNNQSHNYDYLDKNDDNPDNGNSKHANKKHVCILDGPGDSVRVGVINDILAKNGHTPNTVCMSLEACLDIVSTKFNVKKAKHSGVCNNNPSAIHMSDDQIKDLLSSI